MIISVFAILVRLFFLEVSERLFSPRVFFLKRVIVEQLLIFSNYVSKLIFSNMYFFTFSYLLSIILYFSSSMYIFLYFSGNVGFLSIAFKTASENLTGCAVAKVITRSCSLFCFKNSNEAA